MSNYPVASSYFALSWPSMIFSFGWLGLFAWLALFVVLVAAIIIIIRHFLAPDNKADHKRYYPIAYVGFLVFFSIIGFSPFSVNVNDGYDRSGRLDEGIAAFIFAEVVHVLTLGMGLLFVASTLVARITKVYPRYSFLELGPGMTMAITWAFSLGGLFLMPYMSLWKKGLTCSWLEVLGWSAVLAALAAAIITLLRHVRKATLPDHTTLFFQTAPVCFLIFLWGVGISPFLIKLFEAGRPDAAAILILFGQTLLKLGFGGSLLLIASALVAGVTHANPRFCTQTIALITATAIIWGFLVGCLLALSALG
jgi:hypothetical protein